MKIQLIRIKNFRTLKDVVIPFDSVTTFIGPNGTGKSTVLRALDWYFNGRIGCLNDKDCSFGATDEDIEVQVTFDGLTENDRKELGKYTPAGVMTFTAWKRRSPDGVETLSANSKTYAPFSVIRSKSSAAEKKSAYNELRVADASLALPAWSNVEAASQALTTWEADHIEKLVEAPESLQTNFFGFNSGGKMSGLFDFVLVTADLRAGEESIDGKSSIIGRILERSVDRASADEEIAIIVEESRTKQQAVYAEKFTTQLDSMSILLNQVVASYSPGRAITISPTEVELKAPRTTFEVAVRDGTTETVVERQGHGFQRTLLISALQLLAQSGSASTEGVICLAIEEPELYQHPIQAQTFAKVLRALAEDVAKRIQVTYATHSPYFLEARYFSQIRRLTRSNDEIPLVTVHLATLDDVKARLNGVMSGDIVERQLDGVIANQLSIALFAHRVFLVEGTTESSVFHGIADKACVGSLEAAGISIVAVGGKTSLPLAHAILKLIGIPAYSLFDSDGGFEARAKAKGKTSLKIDEERASHAASNRFLLKYFGLHEEDFPPSVVGKDVAIFDDHLEAFLSENWPEWVLACNNVEAAAGISLAKNQLAYRIATASAEGMVPEMLEKILLKAQGK
jgi:putative ATP-dependent endonuclease of OLD family